MAENEQPGGESSLGAELRKQRELRGISLKEIADSTKISKRFLEALEKDDHRTLPAAVFTRGFVREYARYVGLNTDEMVSRYISLTKEIEAREQADSGRLPVLPPPNPALVAHAKRVAAERRRVPYVGITIGVGVALLAVAAVFFLLRRDSTSSTPAPAAVETIAPAPVAPDPVDSEPATPVDGLEMTMKLRENSWVTMEVDGERVINDELRRGDVREIKAKEEILFQTIGNAAALDLTINGVQIPPLGDSGDVLRGRRFDRASIEQLRSETPQ